MRTNKSKAVAAPATKLSLAQLLQQKATTANSYRVSIPAEHILGFDKENPATETRTIFGQTRKVLVWNVLVDGKSAVAVFMVGQIARLYDAILSENLPEGVSLDDKTQSVVVLTDKYSVSKGQKVLNGEKSGFLSLSPFTAKASASEEVNAGFTFA